MFKKDSSFDATKIKKTEIISGKAFYLSNVLTPEECKNMIEYGEKKGFESLAREYRPNYRKSERIIEDNEKMANVWLKRVKKHIPDILKLDGKDQTLYQFPEIFGKWKLDNVNPRFRLCKYNPGGFFRKHYDDGYHPERLSHRTFLTIMVYLNNDFNDGETIFYDDHTQKEIYRLSPKPGDCLIFNQQILHEGNVVKNRTKYMVRSDIFYKKIDTSAKSDTEMALTLLKQAAQAGKEKDYDRAMKLYKKAEELDPNVFDEYIGD